jgi:hypothetical protein
VFLSGAVHKAGLFELMSKLSQKLILVLLLLVPLLASTACKRKDPVYELKPEVGETDTAQVDLMQDQPKYVRIKKSEREQYLAAEERKKHREKSRYMYNGQFGWDEK